MRTKVRKRQSNHDYPTARLDEATASHDATAHGKNRKSKDRADMTLAMISPRARSIRLVRGMPIVSPPILTKTMNFAVRAVLAAVYAEPRC